MKKTVLMILDGWGIGKKDKTDGIFLANTPYIDSLYNKYPNATLTTFGEAVGLPEGQMGNSEVGHLNIGAGRVVYQDLLKLDIAVRDGSFFNNKVFLEAISHAKKNNKKIHLLGLVSKGGVHSSQYHLHALCELMEQQNFGNAFIHAFTDGRDCDPRAALADLTELELFLKHKKTKIASLIGRYYAMDRDKRWERVAKAYRLMVEGDGAPCTSATDALRTSYLSGVTDEFVMPHVITDGLNNPLATIDSDDIVICFNFRTDRCREITLALSQTDFLEYGMKKMPLYYVTMTNYDKTFKEVKVAYDKDNLCQTLGEVMEYNGKTQIRIAETEKYPHVTFFFNGGREEVFKGEERIMVNSPKVATYDLQPEMSAYDVTEKICVRLEQGQTDFVCLNFANGDMVGHTGVPAAIIRACEVIDGCTQKVVETGLKSGYSFLIIADHGNADNMLNLDGSSNTAHSVNPVPCILIDPNFNTINNGILADVAPTILKMMGIAQPKEMTGRALVS